MSLATWKKEFYPIPASRVKKADALAHSVRKWLGLRKAGLKKHGLQRYREGIAEDDCGKGLLTIHAETCALCRAYFDRTGGCDQCPLYQSRSFFSCGDVDPYNEQTSPFDSWVDEGDPNPMIAALRKAQRWEKSQLKMAAKKK